jgi:hypothetical protein
MALTFIFTIQQLKHDKAQQLVAAYKTETPAHYYRLM